MQRSWLGPASNLKARRCWQYCGGILIRPCHRSRNWLENCRELVHGGSTYSIALCTKCWTTFGRSRSSACGRIMSRKAIGEPVHAPGGLRCASAAGDGVVRHGSGTIAPAPKPECQTAGAAGGPQMQLLPSCANMLSYLLFISPCVEPHVMF